MGKCIWNRAVIAAVTRAVYSINVGINRRPKNNTSEVFR